jgi:molybdopterin converting factor small subunit
MPRITVEAAGFIKRIFGRRDTCATARIGHEGGEQLVLSVPEGTTVDALMRLLAENYPPFAAVAFRDGRLVDAIQIVVGDRLLELAGGTDRLLTDGDSVLLLPPFEGGAA